MILHLYICIPKTSIQLWNWFIGLEPFYCETFLDAHVFAVAIKLTPSLGYELELGANIACERSLSKFHEIKQYDKRGVIWVNEDNSYYSCILVLCTCYEYIHQEFECYFAPKSPNQTRIW